MFLRKKKTIEFPEPEQDEFVEEATPETPVSSKVSEEDFEPDPEREAEEVPKKDAGENHSPKYWEFTVFVGIASVLFVVTVFLAFHLIRGIWKGDESKISIKNIPAEITEDKKIGNDSGSTANAKEDKDQETKEVDPKEVSIKILNGGAAGGSAGKMKDVLAALGYKNLEAGNSDKGGYFGNTVCYSSGDMKPVAEKIVADLKSKYPDIQSKAAATAEEKSASIVITLGK